MRVMKQHKSAKLKKIQAEFWKFDKNFHKI